MTETPPISNQDLSKMIYDTMRAKSILATQNALAHNEVLSKTPAYKQKLKQLGTPFLKEMIRLEAMEFDVVQNAENTLEDFKGKDFIDQAFDRSNKIINLLARAVFLDYDEVEETVMALAKNKGSILGLARKINKR